MTWIKKAKWAYIGLSAALVVLGIAIIVYPKISSLVLCYAAALVLVCLGAIKVIGYFKDKTVRAPFRYDFSFGFATLAAGVLLAVFAEKVLTVFVFAVGLGIVVAGAFKLQTAIDAKRFGFRAWWALLAASILSVAVGIFLMADPISSKDAMMIIAGASIVYAGLQCILTVIYVSKLAKLVTTEKVVYEFD